MANGVNRHDMMYPLGVTITENGAEILVQTEAETVELLLFKAGENEPFERVMFKEEDRTGDVWKMSLEGYDFNGIEYGFEADGEWMADPWAKAVSGRKVWGAGLNEDAAEKYGVKARLLSGGFEWEDDKHPEIPYADSIIYRLHVRGFSNHPNSGIRNKGTFAGLVQMIPYIKALGVTAVEMMPITEFDEVMTEEVSVSGTGKKERRSNGKLNFWGYGPSYLYAPKASYGTGFMPVEIEFKILVKELHSAGLECILEMFFTGEEAPGEVLNVLRYWVEEYHVDGFRLSGNVSKEMVVADPFLKRTKLFADDWDNVLAKRAKKSNAKVQKDGTVSVREKNLAVCNDKFQETMRKVLRGDQGMIRGLMECTAMNPDGYGLINYMASNNGFTMADMVSYNEKHNEVNGEDNQDGTDNNWSWNCGEEGETEDERVKKLRQQQVRNAFTLLLLSQGTPLIMAGDEFGNSQNGNNNAYCQDNETSWLDWGMFEENIELFKFVQKMIMFRKMHKAFHMDHAAKNADYKSLGCPDVSYHGVSAWKTDVEYFRKQLGIMYWGAYGKMANGAKDCTYYVAYNMHWGTHNLGLPKLPVGTVWKEILNTSETAAVVKGRIKAQIPPRSIVVFAAVEEDGYATYDTPLGPVTIACQQGKITELLYGRMTLEEEPKWEVVPGHVEEDEQKEEKEHEIPELIELAHEQLEEYFAGKRTSFHLPMAPFGNELEKKIWAEICKIPYGEMRSYKEIAEKLGEYVDSVAVAMANNQCSLEILIPCHRVVGQEEELAADADTNEKRMALLAFEKMHSNL